MGINSQQSPNNPEQRFKNHQTFLTKNQPTTNFKLKRIETRADKTARKYANSGLKK